jgi:hypothetical protein
MSKRRYAGIAAAAALIAGLALVTFVAFADGSQITRANYDRITAGMSLAEVGEVFGGAGMPFHGYADRTAYYWQSDDGSVAIIFFDDDKKVVERAKWADSTETVFDRVRRVIRKLRWK